MLRVSYAMDSLVAGGGLAKEGAEDLLDDLIPASAGLGVQTERGFGRDIHRDLETVRVRSVYHQTRTIAHRSL